MTRSSLFCLLGCATLLGCSSDHSLYAAPMDGPLLEANPLPEPSPGVSPAGPGLPDLPDFPDLPDLPDPPTGPWGEFDPGNIPEIYFAVAWTEYDCSWNDVDGSVGEDEPPDTTEDDLEDGDGIPDTDSDEWWGGCPARYAVIDLLGQVIAEFPLPDEGQNWTPYTHLALEPAGPGQFLAVAENWEDDYDADGDGFWLGTYWQAFRGDAYTGELEELVHWNWAEAQAEITQSGRLLDLGGYNSWAHLGMWANDPDWLVAWSGGQECEPLRDLRQVHLAGEYLDQFWEAEDLLPPELLADGDVQLWPWNMETGLDEYGRPNMLLGVSDTFCADESPASWDLVAWSPADGPLWSAETANYAWMQSARWAGHSGGAMLEVEPTWGNAVWRVRTPDGVTEGELPPEIWDATAGPMLDPQGPTFMVVGSEVAGDGSWHGVLDIHHEGEVVWQIDSLRFGLQDRRVFFEDVVMLPLLPEEEGE